MPAIGTVTINDGQSTPVAHNFNPVDIENATARWADRSTGTPTAYIGMSATQKDPSGSSRNFRQSFTLTLPTIATDPSTGKNYVARTARCEISFVLPETSVLQERKDILAYAKNMLANAMVTSVVQDLEHVY